MCALQSTSTLLTASSKDSESDAVAVASLLSSLVPAAAASSSSFSSLRAEWYHAKGLVSICKYVSRGGRVCRVSSGQIWIRWRMLLRGNVGSYSAPILSLLLTHDDDEQVGGRGRLVLCRNA